MGLNYKTTIGILLFSLLIVSACKKDRNTWQSEGTITGPDIRACVCCGGYFIEIGDSTYNFDSLPSTSRINLEHTDFPVSVNLNWTYGRNCGGIRYIVITRIEKQ